MAKIDIKLVKRRYPVIPSIQASPKKKIKEIMARLPFTFGVLWSVGNCNFFFFYGEWHDLPHLSTCILMTWPMRVGQ